MLQATSRLLATLCCGLFAGAALYVTLVEHPARMSLAPAIAVAQFVPSYQRAAVMQAILATAGFVFAMTAWWNGASGWWLFGGSVLALVIPFTMLIVIPTNEALLDPSTLASADETARLLARWGSLHAVRTFLSVVALVIFLYRLTLRKISSVYPKL